MTIFVRRVSNKSFFIFSNCCEFHGVDSDHARVENESSLVNNFVGGVFVDHVALVANLIFLNFALGYFRSVSFKVFGALLTFCIILTPFFLFPS